jgi:hypothetical protein
MKVSRKLMGITVLGLLMMLSMSVETMGQGRGRRVSRMDKKCGKFVNCHDARDGRVDGRGPNRRLSTRERFFRRNRRNRDFDRRIRIRHNRDRDFGRDRVLRRRG